MTTGNLKLQESALAAAAAGATVLTATGRLARHLLHRHRLGRAGRAFARPPVLSLNAWLHQAWQGLWPETALAPRQTRLALWQRAAALAPPPGGLSITLPLCAQLDEAYAVLVRHGLEAGSPRPGPPLAEWRAEVCAQFERLAAEAGLLHPAHLPGRLTSALAQGRLKPPAEVALAALSAAAPVEEALFAALAKVCRLTRLAPGPPAAPPRPVSLPRLREEAEWCALRVCEAAQEVPPHEIGIVVPSMDDYGPELERALGELLGERVGQGWAAWNLAAPSPLADSGLVRAALLPLRFMLEDEPRHLLLALLTSPYWRRWEGVRHLVARADRSWRRLSVERGLTRLLATAGEPRLSRLIEGEGPRLSELLETLRGRASLPEWLSRLRAVWRALGFPAISGEADRHARERLADCLEALELGAGGAGGKRLGLGELAAWLDQALNAELIAPPGYEHAGLQVLGLLDAPGLAFERLFVLGLHERGLPRPTRELPLLGPEERRRVRGGTWESQLEFARTALGGLLAAGRATWLVRPRLGAEEEPLSPSPLWPAEPPEERLFEAEPAPLWPGFPWREAARAATDRPTPLDFEAGVSLPATIRATALAPLLSCPFGYLAASVLGLEPLEDIRAGISPLERGVRLHRALACLTRRLREAGSGADPQALLEECVARALEGVERDPFWRLERARWLGGEGPPEGSLTGGLLTAWLAKEGGRLASCLAEEIEFAGLRMAGWPFEVTGKIDRLDAEEGGLVCWDYKTGNLLPSSSAPLAEHAQLAAYGLAVRARLLGEELASRPLAGLGYLHLPSAGKVATKRLEPPGGLEAALEEFAAEVARRAAAMSGGHFIPAWEECRRLGSKERERCPYLALCGLLSRLGEPQGEEEEP